MTLFLGIGIAAIVGLIALLNKKKPDTVDDWPTDREYGPVCYGHRESQNKAKLIIAMLALSLPAFSQITDPLLDYQVDSVFNDSLGEYVSVYVLSDTTGDVASGNYTIEVQTLDSVNFIAALYNKTFNALNRVGDVEAARLNFISRGVEYRSKAAEIVGSDEYRAEIAPLVRPALEGDWVYRYDGALTNLTADDLGRFRQADNTLHLIANPWSQVEMYKVAEDFWIGTGAQGRAILRKLN